MQVQILLLLLIVYGISNQDKNQASCQNNGQIDEDSGTCKCKYGFIGNQCQIEAYPLNQNENLITMNQSYQFGYFVPEDVSFYRLSLAFCLPQQYVKSTVKVQFFLQQESFEGTFFKEPLDTQRIIQFQFMKKSKCVTFWTNSIISLRQKLNGQRPKIIMGMRLAPDSKVKQKKISVSCSQQEVFGLNFIKDIGIIFIVFTTFAALSSAFISIRRRLQIRRQAQKKQKLFNKLVTEIMPEKKYETYKKKVCPETCQFNCSICLSEFQNRQKIRQTPCKHIFHKQCIDSWCKNSMSCPICRFSFEDFDKTSRETAQNPNSDIVQMQEVPNEIVQDLRQNYIEQTEKNVRQRML